MVTARTDEIIMKNSCIIMKSARMIDLITKSAIAQGFSDRFQLGILAEEAKKMNKAAKRQHAQINAHILGENRIR